MKMYILPQRYVIFKRTKQNVKIKKKLGKCIEYNRNWKSYSSLFYISWYLVCKFWNFDFTQQFWMKKKITFDNTRDTLVKDNAMFKKLQRNKGKC